MDFSIPDEQIKKLKKDIWYSIVGSYDGEKMHWTIIEIGPKEPTQESMEDVYD